jgi:hypothetical protein
VGQSQGLIDDVVSVDTIVQRIMKEAAEASVKTAFYFESPLS